MKRKSRKCVGRGETREFSDFSLSEKFLKSNSKQILSSLSLKSFKKNHKIDKMRRHTRTDNKLELKILEHPSEMWYNTLFFAFTSSAHTSKFRFYTQIHIYQNGFEGSIES